MKSVLLVPNINKDPQLFHTTKVVNLLLNSGYNISLLDTADKEVIDYSKRLDINIVDKLTDIDFAIVLGGDGTILHLAKKAAEAKVPILGINLGKVGFMAELDKEKIDELPELLSKGILLESRMMENVEIIRDDKVLFTDDALNDVVIRNGIASKLINMEVLTDNIKLFSISADGVVIATPTGSTAYSMSAGGPIVEPTGKNLLLTPICAFALHAKSFVFSPEQELQVCVTNLDDRDAYISVDGKEAFNLIKGDIIRIRQSRFVTQLIRFKKKNFYEVMTKKLLSND